MQKVTFNRAGLAACLFVLGWAGAVGYMSWQYHFNFSPWQKDEASVLPLTQAIFNRQCNGENKPLVRDIVQGNKDAGAFSAAWFDCMSERSDALMHRLSLAVTSSSYMSCLIKADNEGRPDDECKKAFEERMLMHRALKELPAK